MPTKRAQRRAGKRVRQRLGRTAHTNQAPSMHGMQQVSTWNLLDLFPIGASQSFDTAQPVVVELFAGLNEWGYAISQGNTLIGSSNYPYGELAGQYNELANLWSTYRIDSIHLEWKPAQTGAGYHSPIASCLDPAGSVASLSSSSYQDLIKAFSRLRSMRLDQAFNRGSRVSMNYRNWIMQTCPQAFLQTINPQSSVGERTFYPMGDINTAPVIRMAAQIVLGPGISDRTPLGFLRVNARFSVRGRRGLPLAADQVVAMMTDVEQNLVYEYLKRQMGLPDLQLAPPQRSLNTPVQTGLALPPPLPRTSQGSR